MFFSLTESPWIRAGRKYSVRVGFISSLLFNIYGAVVPQDLWAHTDNGTVVRNITVQQVPPHGVIALLLKDAGDEPAGTQPPCARPEWCMNENGTRIDQ